MDRKWDMLLAGEQRGGQGRRGWNKARRGYCYRWNGVGIEHFMQGKRGLWDVCKRECRDAWRPGLHYEYECEVRSVS